MKTRPFGALEVYADDRSDVGCSDGSGKHVSVSNGTDPAGCCDSARGAIECVLRAGHGDQGREPSDLPVAGQDAQGTRLRRMGAVGQGERPGHAQGPRCPEPQDVRDLRDEQRRSRPAEV